MPEYATESSASGNLSTNADEKEVLTTPATAAPAPVPLPGGDTPEAGSPGVNPLPTIAAAAAGVLLLMGFLWSPRLSRAVLRRRRLNQKPPDDANATLPGSKDPAPELAWAELQDLATDYGLPSTPSETPRHFSARLRASAALGEAGGLDDAAHVAVAALTSDFERQRYGRGATGAQGAAPPAASRIAVVRETLRNNTRWLVRFRADWLPPSMMHRWVRALGAPFRAIGKLGKSVGWTLARWWRSLRGLLPQRR